jgi:hypothetical protein
VNFVPATVAADVQLLMQQLQTAGGNVSIGMDNAGLQRNSSLSKSTDVGVGSATAVHSAGLSQSTQPGLTQTEWLQSGRVTALSESLLSAGAVTQAVPSQLHSGKNNTLAARTSTALSSPLLSLLDPQGKPLDVDSRVLRGILDTVRQLETLKDTTAAHRMDRDSGAYLNTTFKSLVSSISAGVETGAGCGVHVGRPSGQPATAQPRAPHSWHFVDSSVGWIADVSAQSYENLPEVVTSTDISVQAIRHSGDGQGNMMRRRPRKCPAAVVDSPCQLVDGTQERRVVSDIDKRLPAQNTTVTTSCDVSLMETSDKVDRVSQVAEHVGHVLKPYFKRGHINKHDYKEILRKAVPKICASRVVDLKSERVSKFVDAYVSKTIALRKRRDTTSKTASVMSQSSDVVSSDTD